MPTQYSFSSIPFYKAHPYMQPFVGKNYESDRHKKLLLIGESFYVTKESNNPHHHVKEWYDGTIDVNTDDQGWCNTTGTRLNKSGDYGKIVERSLQSICPTNGNAWEEVAFINYFLRPADYRKNIAKLWKGSTKEERRTDRKEALDNLLKVIDILKPDVFVMTSAFVCKKNAEHDYPIFYPSKPKKELWDWTIPHGVADYIYVNHPSQACWHQAMNKYGKFLAYKNNKPKGEQEKYKACDFFRDWLANNWMY